MKHTLILILLLLFVKAHPCVQDSIRIKVDIVRNSSFSSGWLEGFGIKKYKLLEFKIKDGKIDFFLPNSIEPGVYRLHLDTVNSKPYIDLIVDGKEPYISFNLDIYGFDVYPFFFESVENSNWYFYLNESQMMVARLDSLFCHLSMFNPNLNEDRLTVRVYQKERKKYYALFDAFIKKNENRWCALLVKNRPYYYSDLNTKPVERDFVRKNFYWEGIDTNNDKLIFTPLYEELIDIFFKKYYLNPTNQYTINLNENYLKKDIEEVISKFSNNSKTKAFIYNYLNTYFNKLERHDLINYINSVNNK